MDSVVIIGTGAAGLSTLERIREIDSKSKIIIISKDRNPYSLCALPYLLSGDMSEKNLYSYNSEYFKGLNAEPILGRKVSSVNPKRKLVMLDTCETIRYDKLLIAVGSKPSVPGIKGIDKKGVYYLNSLEDCKMLLIGIPRTKKAVIIGAGFTGLEIAVALRKRGIDVTVIETEDRVLPTMLDKDMANLVRNVLVRNGVRIILKNKVNEIIGSNKVHGVKLNTGTLAAEMVVVTAGVKPNTDIVQNTAIRTNRGIIVDLRMQSSVKNIYAAGDVAEYIEPETKKFVTSALWLPAVYQGKVAGSNIVGHRVRYVPFLDVRVINIFGIPVLKMGARKLSFEPEDNVSVLKIKKRQTTKKIILKDERIAGLQSINDPNCRGMLSLLNQKMKITRLEKNLLGDGFYHPFFAGLKQINSKGIK